MLFAAVVIGALRVNPFHSKYLQTGNLANSEDPDEMPPNVAFHQGLHCLLLRYNLQELKYIRI